MKITTEESTMRSTLRHPDLEPAHPGAIMAEVVEDLGIGKAEMARRLGVTRAALYNVLDEKSAITADMAVRFEQITGTPAELMTRMQASHDVWRARRNPKMAQFIRLAQDVSMSAKKQVAVKRQTVQGAMAKAGKPNPLATGGTRRKNLPRG